jgi:hypothetical protein
MRLPGLYCPPALQLPAEAHDTEAMNAFPPWLRAVVPGTSSALPQACLLSEPARAPVPATALPLASNATPPWRL